MPSKREITSPSFTGRDRSIQRKAAEYFRCHTTTTAASGTPTTQSHDPAAIAANGIVANSVQSPKTATTSRVKNDKYAPKLHVSP
jgi:hypothetical protein